MSPLLLVASLSLPIQLQDELNNNLKEINQLNISDEKLLADLEIQLMDDLKRLTKQEVSTINHGLIHQESVSIFAKIK